MRNLPLSEFYTLFLTERDYTTYLTNKAKGELMETNAYEQHFKLLGMKVKDKVTGYSGVVTSLSFDLYGCVQAVITPITGKDKDWIQMYCQAKNVLMTEDKAVIPEFKSGLMVTNDIEFNPSIPLYGGLDFGSGTLWPAIILGQRDPYTGAWHILDEICATESRK